NPNHCLTMAFSSFEEAERVSKAMGEEHAVSSGLSGAADGAASQASMSLIRQRVLSPAELMAMPADRQLIHVKGAGFFLAGTISQNQIAPFCHLIARNPLEGGRLPADPKITFPKPQRGRA
ncbi:MAG: type IV secretory system conjugative DNA transfer family protein, partial [Pseudomonadota bacterium]